MISEGFPYVTVTPSCGQWWRVHSASNGPWWFASSDDPERDESQIGRFDLPTPFGTCYLGAYLAGAAAKSLRESVVSHAKAQEAASERRLSQMPLNRWYGCRLADFTWPGTAAGDAPPDIATLDRGDARQWAAAAHAVGFAGILYRLREDPHRRQGLALFSAAGEHAAPDQPSPQPLPVGLRHELVDLFDGELRGDPLPKFCGSSLRIAEAPSDGAKLSAVSTGRGPSSVTPRRRGDPERGRAAGGSRRGCAAAAAAYG